MVFNLAIALLLLLALFGVKKIRNSLRKKATGSRGRVPRKAGTGLRLLTLAEYEANMRKTTEREKQKLYRSAEYKKCWKKKVMTHVLGTGKLASCRYKQKRERLIKSHHVATTI